MVYSPLRPFMISYMVAPMFYMRDYLWRCVWRLHLNLVPFAHWFPFCSSCFSIHYVCNVMLCTVVQRLIWPYVQYSFTFRIWNLCCVSICLSAWCKLHILLFCLFHSEEASTHSNKQRWWWWRSSTRFYVFWCAFVVFILNVFRRWYQRSFGVRKERKQNFIEE